jgi:RsiW-degrading membrane proteinase PrsW (M82 family)
VLLGFISPIALVLVIMLMVIGLYIGFSLVMKYVMDTFIFYSVLIIAIVFFVLMCYFFYKKGYWSVYVFGVISGTLLGFLLCSAFASYLL